MREVKSTQSTTLRWAAAALLIVGLIAARYAVRGLAGGRGGGAA